MLRLAVPALAVLLLAPACGPSTGGTPLDAPTASDGPVGPEEHRDAALPGDVTFFAMGDPQYGGGPSDKNDFQIRAMNGFPGKHWRDELPSAGTEVAAPRGVIIAGDLTQNGQDDRALIGDSDEIGGFLRDYGLTGSDGQLRFPVYEGWGNHDYDAGYAAGPDTLWRLAYNGATPAVEAVVDRNPSRPGLAAVAPDRDGAYSWDWDHVHFVQLNLFPGDAPSMVEADSKLRDPRRSLTFLHDDLARIEACRPVVIIFHYGFDDFGLEPRWWTDEQRDAFAQAIEGHNVIALLHGHTHTTALYEWRGIPVLDVGSPFYDLPDGHGHFAVVRITDRIEAADVQWTSGAGGADTEYGSWWLSQAIDGCR